MSDDLHGAQPVEDVEDIPTLTDIVVPGRLRAEPPPAAAPSDFVFDIEFDQRPAPTTPAAIDEVVESPWSRPPTAPSAPIDDDLPLPWGDERPAPATPAPSHDLPSESGVADEPTDDWNAPVPDAPHPDQPQPTTPATPDIEALLGDWLNDIAAALEPRIDAELALAGQRLRAALREELDTRLRELLAGAPPKT